MDADAVSEFATASAESRHAVFGPLTAPGGIRHKGQTWPAVVSTISTTQELERGGWKVEVSTVVRVLRQPGFQPTDGDTLVLARSRRVLRVVEIKDNIPAEWVLGCVDPES